MMIPSISSASEGSKVSLISDPFFEVMREAALISGARMVGLISTGEDMRGVDVAAIVPGDWRGSRVCLKVVSADGLYESVNAYTVAPDWAGGAVALPYPTMRPQDVAAIPGDLISGVLFRGDCVEGSTEAAPVLWGRGGRGPLRVLLNTARAEETYLAFPANPDHGDVLCGTIPAAARNAFDTVCELPPALAGLDRLDAVALSFKGGEMGREQAIVLRPGGAH